MLRTVTFSDKKVAELVNANFVSAWVNRSPGFCNNSDEAEKSIFQGATEAFLTKNICTFVLAPDGRVFHYAAGYLSPELFLRFLEDALALRRAGFDQGMIQKPGGLDAMRKLHAERATARQAEFQTVQRPADGGERTYRNLTHRHNENCSWQLQEVSSYFLRVHRFWEKAAALPALDDLRYQYLYGNDFSEEGPGASPIKRDATLARFR